MFENLRTVWWDEEGVFIVDQNRLPVEFTFKVCTDVDEVIEAIKDMTIRGAPAIGAAAAMGLALAAKHCKASSMEEFKERLKEVAKAIENTRPTAYNLTWALRRVLRVMDRAQSLDEARRLVVEEAIKIADEDVEVNKAIGRVGVALLRDGCTVLTHCNAGSLATVGYGTALAPIREALRRGIKVKVIATETRPKLQGARITSFELKLDGVPVKVITDNMVAYVMQKGAVDLVLVGADRVLRDGHVVNKIGTLAIAIIAKHFNVPLYVAAPTSTFDLDTDVDNVVIEERDWREVAYIGGCRLLPRGVEVLNPAFDITPPDLITGFITEKGVLKPPFNNL